MAKKTETAVDVKELTATPIITIEELMQDIEKITPTTEVNEEATPESDLFEDVKGAFNEIIDHYYMDVSDKITEAIGDHITDFKVDYIKELADYCDRLKDFYWEIDESQDEDDLRAAMVFGGQSFSDFLGCEEEALRQLLKSFNIEQAVADKVVAIIYNE